MNPSNTYIGRFAPSPTGPLHFGSLVAATASYLDARANNGKWLVRMEDLDKPREMPGAADDILRTLETFGFEWDDDILYQSQRDEVYQAYTDQLHQTGLLYPCGCTRKEIDRLAHAGIEGPVYPGTCRNGLPASKQARAWRVRVNDELIEFNDVVQGIIQHHLQSDIGDFVIKRADGLFAYQLAVVADDAEQGINHIVRGADLLNSTTRQIYLQQQLNLNTPCYAHIPLVIHANGEKLSKQTRAAPVNSQNPETTLIKVLQFLGMEIPDSLPDQNAIWHWGMQHWQMNHIPHEAKPIPAYSGHTVNE